MSPWQRRPLPNLAGHVIEETLFGRAVVCEFGDLPSSLGGRRHFAWAYLNFP